MADLVPCYGCLEQMEFTPNTRVPALDFLRNALGRNAEVADLPKFALCKPDCVDAYERSGVRTHQVGAQEQLIRERLWNKAMADFQEQERLEAERAEQERLRKIAAIRNARLVENLRALKPQSQPTRTSQPATHKPGIDRGERRNGRPTNGTAHTTAS